MNMFFKEREQKLSWQLYNLEKDVDTFLNLKSSPKRPSERKIKSTESSLKMAYSEFYLNLSLLQNFQQLNYTGFRKILKKFDKLASSGKGKRFLLENVATADFYTSATVQEMIATAENTMIQKLEGGNRHKAMKTLRVPPLEAKGQASHWDTFKTGLYTGVFALSLVVLCVAAALRPPDSWGDTSALVSGMRGILILVCWFYGFAINTYVWRRRGVNNVLIFEFDPRHNLNYIQLFEIASLLGVLGVIGAYLLVFSYWIHIPAYVGPLVSYILIFGLLLLPLPIFRPRSRIWLIKELVRICCAPFFFVTFPDFWIADQLNSLSTVLLDIEFFACFIFVRNVQCGSAKYGIRAVVAVLPAWFRFAQCLRRFHSTKRPDGSRNYDHLINAGKYSTSFFVVLFSSLASGVNVSGAQVQASHYYVFFSLWIVSAMVSSCYTFYWDIRKDWGLFEGKHKLREELIYPKYVYILAIIEDLVLRSLWTLNISVGQLGPPWQATLITTILALMETFRRIVWNFFRLENEHLNNCDQYRVVRDISIRPMKIEATIQNTNP